MGTGLPGKRKTGRRILRRRRPYGRSKRHAGRPGYDLVVLDELTYMLAYHYLDTQEVIAAIVNRPPGRT
jgi:ATP:corrinoid adenosyltransferase